MRIRHELSIAWAALVVVQVLTLFGAVGLLARVTPAVGNILADNESSIELVELMLVELGAHVHDDGAKLRFEQALSTARANVTEEDEPEQLALIEEAYASALDGDPIAHAKVTDALQALALANRRAMGESSSDASELGRTGAWAAVVLGLLSLASAIAVARRIERRVIAPVELVAQAVESICAGDQHRRCPSEGPVELVALARGVESLRQRPDESKQDSEPGSDAHRLLIAMLDAVPSAALLVDAHGKVLHGNLIGTNALLRDPSLVSRLHKTDAPLPQGWGRLSLAEGLSLVCIAAAETERPRGPRRALEA